MNNYDWAITMMSRCRVVPPLTAATEGCVVRWMAAENPPSLWYWKNNPLNVADFVTDSQAFPSLDAAATATAQVLSQDNMAIILNSLVAGGNLDVFSYACSVAPWSTGGYHGKPGYIASIPLPPAVEAPGTGPDPPAPAPTPVPTTDPLLAFLEEALMDTDFAVRYLYRMCLKREVDPGGFATWTNYLNSGGTLNNMMSALQDSPEGSAVLAGTLRNGV